MFPFPDLAENIIIKAIAVDTIIAEKINFVNRISASFKKLYKSAEGILTPYERRCNREIIAQRLSLITAVKIFHREGT